MCLAWLDQHVKPDDTVLDYGCGSGVLAIAAALLGARSITATDIDPQALIATRDNALANACDIHIFGPDALHAANASMVVANILTNPLKVLAPALSARVSPGGRLTLSGILETQAGEVIAAYAPFIGLDVWRCEEGWVCLSGTK
jgi:ribosomal protein L11 methyltransferase